MPKNDLKGDLVIDGRFEWWSKKDEANIAKHHYSFKEIEKVFDDPYFYEIYDANHSTVEQIRREAYFERLRRIYR